MNYYVCFLWSLVVISFLLFFLSSPNICYLLHKRHFCWKEEKKLIDQNKTTLGEDVALANKYKNFDIEYMPTSNRYYPRHKGEYLYYWSGGYYSTQIDRAASRYGNTKEMAISIYDEFLEYEGITSQIIKYP